MTASIKSLYEEYLTAEFKLARLRGIASGAVGPLLIKYEVEIAGAKNRLREHEAALCHAILAAGGSVHLDEEITLRVESASFGAGERRTRRHWVVIGRLPVARKGLPARDWRRA